MERNTKTTVYNLQIGDRFYRCNDRHKTVYEKIDHKAKQTQWQTYKHWAVDVKYLGRVITGRQLESVAKAVKADTEVIFLRHKEE